MRVKIVGCLGPIAMRQNAIEANKVIKLIENNAYWSQSTFYSVYILMGILLTR